MKSLRWSAEELDEFLSDGEEREVKIHCTSVRAAESLRQALFYRNRSRGARVIISIKRAKVYVRPIKEGILYAEQEGAQT